MYVPAAFKVHPAAALAFAATRGISQVIASMAVVRSLRFYLSLMESR